MLYFGVLFFTVLLWNDTCLNLRISNKLVFDEHRAVIEEDLADNVGTFLAQLDVQGIVESQVR